MMGDGALERKIDFRKNSKSIEASPFIREVAFRSGRISYTAPGLTIIWIQLKIIK